VSCGPLRELVKASTELPGSIRLLSLAAGTAGVHRFFCSNCGSPIISTRDTLPDIVRVRLGTRDTPLAGPPSAHIFVGSKAEWWQIRDQLPQHLERP
jgi:hypothetical protein